MLNQILKYIDDIADQVLEYEKQGYFWIAVGVIVLVGLYLVFRGVF